VWGEKNSLANEGGARGGPPFEKQGNLFNNKSDQSVGVWEDLVFIVKEERI